MRKYFFAGLIILLPITITLMILTFVVDFFTSPFNGLIEWVYETISQTNIEINNHKTIFVFTSRILIIFSLFIITLFLGFIGRKFLFRSFFQFTSHILSRMPLIRPIYRVTKEITKQIFGENKLKFDRAAVTVFPHEGARAVCFKTAPAPEESLKQAGMDPSKLETIFIPTSPHPISGFVLITPKEDSKDVDLTVEEVLKFLISCGVYTPDKQRKEVPNKDSQGDS